MLVCIIEIGLIGVQKKSPLGTCDLEESYARLSLLPLHLLDFL